MLEYVNGMQNTASAFYNTTADVAEYNLPLGES
jgi:hypothetical protein